MKIREIDKIPENGVSQEEKFTVFCLAVFWLEKFWGFSCFLAAFSKTLAGKPKKPGNPDPNFQ